jgi:hypothetical protein
MHFKVPSLTYLLMTTSPPQPDVLTWAPFTSSEDMPLQEVVLLEDNEGKFHTGLFRKANNSVLGFVSGRFHFDHKLIRWASIQHILPEPTIKPGKVVKPPPEDKAKSRSTKAIKRTTSTLGIEKLNLKVHEALRGLQTQKDDQQPTT